MLAAYTFNVLGSSLKLTETLGPLAIARNLFRSELFYVMALARVVFMLLAVTSAIEGHCVESGGGGTCLAQKTEVGEDVAALLQGVVAVQRKTGNQFEKGQHVVAFC